MIISLVAYWILVPLMASHIFHTNVERVSKTKSTRQYTTHWFNQTLDHFTFTTQKQFRQKFLVNDTFWDRLELSVWSKLILMNYLIQ